MFLGDAMMMFYIAATVQRDERKHPFILRSIKNKLFL